MDKVRVFITDWQVLFREGIHFTLSGEDEFEVIGEATGNEEALDFIENNPPRVAILNADRSKPSGIDITRRIKQNLPSVGVVLVMDNYNDEQLLAAMKSGASACMSKDMDPDELLSIVRKVVQGEQPISQSLLEPGIAGRIIDEFEATSQLSEETGNLLARLLAAESQILQQIVNGNLLEEIARNQGISEADVRQHLGTIHSKLVTNDRSREVIEAAQNNFNTVISRISPGRRSARQTGDYITREEFNAFKESLLERFRSLIGGLGQ